MVNLVAWVSCVSTLHGHLHLNGSSLLETEGQRNMFTFLKGTMKTDQHDVVPCGLQYYGFAWDNLTASMRRFGITPLFMMLVCNAARWAIGQATDTRRLVVLPWSLTTK
jgi:hypothetical protein